MTTPIARNVVVEGPDALSEMVFSVAADPTGMDGSPIYLTLDAEVIVNGSYYGTPSTAYEDIEYIYSSVTLTAPTLSRSSIRDDFSVFADDFSGGLEIDRHANVGEKQYFDSGYTGAAIGSTSFVAFQGLQLGRLPAPYDIPGFEYSENLSKENLTAGTARDHSTTPATDTDIGVKATFTGPLRRGTIEDGDLEILFVLGIERYDVEGGTFSEDLEIAVDASAWGSADFRDIRGTYSDTSVDSKGISYTWEFVIG